MSLANERPNNAVQPAAGTRHSLRSGGHARRPRLSASVERKNQVQKSGWVVPAAAGFVVIVLVATWLGGWVQADACVDAGGRFDPATGFCDAALGTPYVAPFARPGSYLLWGVVLGISLAAGLMVFVALRYVMRRGGRGPA